MSDANGNDPLPELPAGWEWKTFGQVADCRLGKMLDKQKNVGEPRPYLRNINVQWDRFDLSDVKEMRIADHEVERYEVRQGDLLVCEGGEPGRCAIWNAEDPMFFQKALHRVRSGPLVSTQYLQLSLRFAAMSGRLDPFLTGTTIKHLPGEKLHQLPISIPPREQQDEIVRHVTARVAEVYAGRSAIERALHDCKSLRNSLLNATIQRGEIRTVGDLLLAIEAGKSFRCHGRLAELDEWGVIKVSAMTWGRFDEAENKAVIDARDVNQRWEIRPGDLLVSRANTSEYVGASVFVEDCRPRLLLSDKSLRLQVVEEVDPAWLQLALSAPTSRAQMSAIATGTSDSMRNLSQNKLRSISVRVPSLREQRSIVHRVSAQLQTLHVLRDSISAQMSRAATLELAILGRACLGEGVREAATAEKLTGLASTP